MTLAEPYVMLMASLPAIRLLGEKSLPINAARLTERLKLLTPEDREELRQLNEILSWNRVDTTDDDSAFVARAERTLAATRSETLKTVIRERLEIRTVIAALRRRHDGEAAPGPDVDWGIGRYVATIRQNWNAPDFGVGRFFPWVLSAKDKLETGDWTGLERLVLDVSWAAVARQEFGHEFDLEAVALYLLRWMMADRWARYDADAAAVRFQALLDEALAGSVAEKEAA